VRVVFDDEDARKGRAAHELFEKMISGITDADLSWIADKNNLYDTDDLAKMYAYMNKVWHVEGLKDRFMPANHLRAEEELSCCLNNSILKGSADLSWWFPGTSKVLDLKTGNVVKNVWGQIKGYLILQIDKLSRSYPFADLEKWEYWGYVLWLRHWYYDAKKFTFQQLMEYKESIVSFAESKDPPYVVSPECKYCPRQYVDCQKYQEIISHIVELGASIQGFDFDKNADQILEIDNRFKILQKLCDTWGDFYKARRLAGPIVLSDGSRIINEPVLKRQITDLRKLKPIALKYMTEEDLLKCISISITHLEKTVKANAPKGKGAATMREMEQDLEEKQLISQVPHSSRILVVKPETKELQLEHAQSQT
jgi:hypothetical protein